MRFLPASLATFVGALTTTVAVSLVAPAAHAYPRLVIGLPHSDTKTETRPVTGNFTGVSLATSDDVVIRQGSPAAITISGPADELARTETVIEKGSLVIRKKNDGRKLWTKNDHVVVTVTMPVIESLSISGSGDMRTEGTVTGNDLAVSLAGSGDLHATLDLKGACSTSVAGSGDVQLAGRCASHSVRLAGSGDIKADKMTAGSATVRLSGSGNVSVGAEETLDASISGSGDIRYAGNPKQLIKRVTGSGSVAKM